jgi:hypothetical protein
MGTGSGKLIQFLDQAFFGDGSNVVYSDLGTVALTVYLNTAAPALVNICG